MLTAKEYNRLYDTSDIGVYLLDRSPRLIKSLSVVTGSYLGVQFRVPGFRVGKLKVENVVNDCVALWAGDQVIENLELNDIGAYTYSKFNHKDLLQGYNLTKNYKISTEAFKGLTINKFTAKVRGDSKHGLHFTEVCGYEDFRLFEGGITYDSGSDIEYFLSSINAVNWVIGSPEHPIDPAKTSGKGIRIMGVKPGSPPSSNITIHAYPGLLLHLDDSAKKALKLIEYRK